MPTPEREIADLREQINHHDYLYYVEGQPVISDHEYDRLFARLKVLEAAHPELAAPDSPTQRVGGEPLEGFTHVTHAVPMLSIDNTYNEAEVREFDGRVTKGLGDEPYEYIVDPKIDGVSASLRYEVGVLVLGATRGDGRTGDDVTANIKTIRAIPLRLRGKGWPQVLEVRGEVYWPREAFDAFNAKREKAGLELFANPRNATAGTLKQLDSKIVAGRGLAFMAHGFGQIEGAEYETAGELFATLKRWGIPTNPHTRICKDVGEVLRFIEKWESQRHGLGYETDGLVVKVNRLDQRETLGATSRYPRWCIAYKYAAEQAESVLRSVDFQVGKLGTITPRAVMDPMQLSGTTVRHATLHNFDQVERLDVRIGDTVVVEKAGEIIPQVIRVVVEKRPKDAKRIVPPAKCPVCKGEVAKDDGGVYIRCINPACDAQLKERLKYFCGRDQMDVEGLGDIWIERLVDEDVVMSIAGLYDLEKREKHLASLVVEGEFGAENADALLADIELVRHRSLDALEQVASKHRMAPENALIPLTKEVARKLAALLPTLESFILASDRTIQGALSDDPESAERLCAFLCPTGREGLVRSICALIDKDVLPLRGIGKTTVERLIAAGLVRRPADLFELRRHREELASLKLPRTFGEKNARAVVESLRISKQQPLARVLAALNIRHVGGATAALLAERFGDMERIAEATEEQLQEVEGVGSEVARSVRQFFQSPAGRKTWQALRDAGVNMRQPKAARTGHQPLAGKIIVVTGTLSNFDRRGIEKVIKELGGKPAGNVSKRTDYLICGEDPGSKLANAQSLGVKVLSEAQFLELIGRTG
jgi:DNA ligase (NAD+)